MKCKWANADQFFQTFDPDLVLKAAVEVREKECEYHLSAAPENLFPDHDLEDHDLFFLFCLNNMP